MWVSLQFTLTNIYIYNSYFFKLAEGEELRCKGGPINISLLIHLKIFSSNLDPKFETKKSCYKRDIGRTWLRFIQALDAPFSLPTWTDQLSLESGNLQPNKKGSVTAENRKIFGRFTIFEWNSFRNKKRLEA
jgi:hypothetical protein